MNNKKAVILLSGGLDSATVLYYAKSKGYELYALSFDYGQRHKKELSLAKKLSRKNNVPIKILKISLPWKGSSLIDKTVPLPKAGKKKNTIPNTYVPSRNMIFLSFAASYAETIGASSIFIGANQVDYSGYPDCRQDFLKAFSAVIRKGTKAGLIGKAVKVNAPLIHMSKKDIIKKAFKLGVPLWQTWSCYYGGKYPCLKCEACLLRIKGFKAAGINGLY